MRRWQAEHVMVDQHLSIEPIDRRVERGPVQPQVNAAVTGMGLEEAQDVADLGGDRGPDAFLLTAPGDGVTVGIPK
jgi:hypothetical protein